MKKQSLLLISGGLLALASCNTEPAADTGDTQAKIDSMVNERVEQIRLELQAQNDSIINEMAMYRADSIIAARTGKAAPSRPKLKAPQADDRATETTKEVEETKQPTSKSKWESGEKGTTSESKWGDKEKEGTSSESKWNK